ncbi:hypothetical protein FQA39_LY01927 [Lamprigera yunnana]|nr:hypothetical protein FQA39_LY01927 [Lamprigera yunnana]
MNVVWWDLDPPTFPFLVQNVIVAITVYYIYYCIERDSGNYSDESDYIPDQEFESDISDSDEEFSDSESEDDFIEPRFFGDWKVVSDPFIDNLVRLLMVHNKLKLLSCNVKVWAIVYDGIEGQVVIIFEQEYSNNYN